jgi:hypothetical protein
MFSEIESLVKVARDELKPGTFVAGSIVNPVIMEESVGFTMVRRGPLKAAVLAVPPKVTARFPLL